MDQESRMEEGISRFDPAGFAKAKFGKRTTAIKGDLLEGSDWLGQREQIGTIRFHGTKAVVHFVTWQAELLFPNNPEIREIRARCQSMEGGPLPLCRLSRARDSALSDREVDVEFIFAAEQLHLQGDLHFRIEESLAASANWSAEPAGFPAKLLQSLAFQTGKGWVLLARFYGMLGERSADGPDLVEFLNSNGDIVECHIEYGMASGWLSAVGYISRQAPAKADGRRKSYWQETRVRIFGFDRPPVLARAETGGDMATLEALCHKTSTFLSCWKRYRESLHEMAKSLYERRKNHILTFRAGVIDPDDPSCHRVHIANWIEAQEHWGEVKDTPVFVARDQNGLVEDGSRSEATLLQVGPEGDARIRWKRTIPHVNGVIMVTGYSVANDRRVGRAIDLLEKGLSAYPYLISALNDPATVLEPKKLSIKPRGGMAFDESQLEAFTKAMGNRSIVAIQGPPGTGKTRVIAGVIKELYRKRRPDGGLAGTAPFRVLISSAQNIAVFNAVDLLANEGILIDQRLSSTARDARENAARVEALQEGGKQISQRIQERIEKVPKLKFQVDSADALTRILREITEISHSSDTYQLLVEAFGRWRSSPLPDHLMRLLDRHAGRLGDLVMPQDGRADDREMRDKVEELLSSIKDAEQVRESAPRLMELEAAFDEVGLGHLHESLRIKFRELSRASRDHLADAEESIGKEIRKRAALGLQEIKASALSEDEVTSQGFHKEVGSCLRNLSNELEEYRNMVTKEVGGVLHDWSRALAEEPGLWRRLVEKYAEIRGATCQMAAPQTRFEGMAPSEQYDLVVIDEAARIDPGELLIPITLGKVILMVGDQKQLPPYIDELAAGKLQRDDPSGFELLRQQSFFHELFEALPDSNKAMLDRQYRCHPVIGRAISNAFYEGRLHSGPAIPTSYAGWASSKTPTWNVFENHPLCWIDTDRVGTTKSCTSCNPAESDLAIQILGRAIAAIEEEGKQIGVISFYKEQLKHLQARLEQAIPNYKRLMEVDTVDSFQGKEFPFVILLTSRRDPANGNVGFLSLPNRVNVAVSRAQRQLVIIGSRGTLLHKTKGSQPFKDFVGAAGTDMRFIES